MKFLRNLLATVAVLLAVAIALVMTLDLGALAKPLAIWAGKQAGVPITIDGSLSLRVGSSLVLSVEELRVGTQDDSGTLAVQRLDVDVKALSLFDRPVVIQRVAIAGADLVSRPAKAKSGGTSRQDEGFRWPESLPFVIDDVDIRDSHIRLEGPRLSRPLDIRLNHLRQRRDPDDMLELEGDGQVNETALSIKGTVGSFENLVKGRDFSIQSDLAVGDLALVVDARIDDVARPSRSTVDLKLQAPDAEYLRSRLGLENLGAGPVSLQASVSPAATGPGVQARVAGQIGEFTIDASGELAEPAVMAKLVVDLTVSGPDLSLAGGLAGIEGLPRESFQLTAALDRSQDRLHVSGARLQMGESSMELQGEIEHFSNMTGNDVTFGFNGPDIARFRELLGLPGVARGPFSLTGRLWQEKPGTELVELQVSTNLASAKAKGTLGAHPDYVGTDVHVDVSGDSLARFGDAAGITDLPQQAFTFQADVNWTEQGAMLRNAKLQAGRNLLKLDGRIGEDPLGSATDFKFAINGDNLKTVSPALGLGDLPAGPYDFKGRLRRKSGATQLTGLQGTMGGARVELDGIIGDVPADQTDVELAASGPRLEAFAGLTPQTSLPAGKFSMAGSITLRRNNLTLRKFDVSAGGAQGRADMNLALPLSDLAGSFDVSARGPNLSRLLPPDQQSAALEKAFELVAQGTVSKGKWIFEKASFSSGAGSLTATGTLDWQPDFSGTSFRLEATSGSLAEVGRLIGKTLPALPLQLTAEVSGTPSTLQVSNASGKLGKSDFAGQLGLSLAERPRVDLVLQSQLLNLRPFLGGKDSGAGAGTRGGKVVAPEADRETGRLIPDTPLPLGWLDAFDGSLKLQAEEIWAANLTLYGLVVDATLKAGVLRVEKLEMRAPPAGNLVANAELSRQIGEAGQTGQTSQGDKANLYLVASGKRIGMSLPDDTPALRAKRPRADFELTFSGQGGSLRELAAASSGQFSFQTGAGELPGMSGSAYFGSLRATLLALISPGSREEPVTRLSCVALFANITDGVAEAVPAMVVQTDTLTFFSRGIVNLGTEAITVQMRVKQRDQLDISLVEIANPNVTISGTLANPKFGLSATSTLITGGAAFATGGLSILARSVWDQIFRSKDPCGAAATEARNIASGKSDPEKSLLPRWLRRPFGN